ncbi:hypothetical protein BMS3Abin09_00182 [bacterium BMS3Abin09]|nr:hypothetical protein BMS3Abin09_00182 [bacterium BMS3Abin09]
MRDLHDLFLVKYDPVGLLEYLIQLRKLELCKRAGRFFLARRFFCLFSLDILINHAASERSRPVKRDERDKVFEDLGFHSGQEVLHARTFELEHTGCLSCTQKYERNFIIDRDVLDREGYVILPIFEFSCGINDLFGLINKGQGLKPQKVELQELDLLDGVHIELRGDSLIVRGLIQWKKVGKRIG